MIAGGASSLAAVVFGNYTPRKSCFPLVFGASNALMYRLQARDNSVAVPLMIPCDLIVSLCCGRRSGKSGSGKPYIKNKATDDSNS